MKRIPTQRTTTRVTALEPPIQTPTMEHIPTSPAPLTRQLPLRTDHAVADAALRLALQRRRDVLPPRHQPLNQTAAVAFAREVDDALRGDEPGAPFLLVDADAVDGFDGGAGEGVGGWEADRDRHGLLVDGDGGGDFAGGEGDFDGEGLVGGGLGGAPGADGGELVGDDQRGDLYEY